MAFALSALLNTPPPFLRASIASYKCRDLTLDSIRCQPLNKAYKSDAYDMREISAFLFLFVFHWLIKNLPPSPQLRYHPTEVISGTQSEHSHEKYPSNVLTDSITGSRTWIASPAFPLLSHSLTLSLSHFLTLSLFHIPIFTCHTSPSHYHPPSDCLL